MRWQDSMSGKIFYWQEQLTLYINWHHTVSDIYLLNTLKKCLEGLVISHLPVILQFNIEQLYKHKIYKY